MIDSHPPLRPRGGLRHKWFPVLVIAAAAAWLIYRAVDVRYMTAGHVLVVLSTAHA